MQVDLAVDSAGNAYVDGKTASHEDTFPVLAGPGVTNNGGERDGFVAEVSGFLPGSLPMEVVVHDPDGSVVARGSRGMAAPGTTTGETTGRAIRD